MINLKKTINIALGAVILMAAGSCTEEDYMLYDTTQKDSVFFAYRNDRNELVDKIEYAFNFDIATTHTIEIPVTLMGMPKDHDRTIEIVAVADSTTMKEGVNYTITNNIIPANEVKGKVQINLIRDLDPEIQEMSKRVMLTIGENDDLKSVGENSITIAYSDIRPETRPGWWLTWSPIPVYSFENAQLFFQYFYEYAPKADINLYNEMIERYGDYFVNAGNVGGPFAFYDSFLRNYVCIPLYRDHPELEWQNNPGW